MGFHGIVDSLEGPETPCRCHDTVDCSNDGQRPQSSRRIISHHRNNGPIDLSKLYTYVPARGSWSIGGQRPATQTLPPIQTQTPLHQLTTTSHPQLNSATASASASASSKDPTATSLVYKAKVKHTNPSPQIPELDAAPVVGRKRPGIINTSSLLSESTLFSGEGSSGPGYVGSPAESNSSCGSDNEVQEEEEKMT